MRKVPVSERALSQRIERKLRKDNKWLRLRKARGSQARSNLGDWYVLDLYRNAIVYDHVDLEQWGKDKDMNCLAPYEYLGEST